MRSTYLAKKDFEEYAKDNYTKCATVNYNRNIEKSYLKHKGQVYLFYSMPFVFLCALLLLLGKFNDKEFFGIDNVEREATMEQEMTDDDKKPTEQETKPATLEKPVGPPTRQIKEGFDPRKVKNSDDD
ncbi:hypothetical protein [Parvibaculum sp.]|uniref:hypothetical protein n=1 Tax=Parvibaculum sp. TaxID=2024848 RepID=UPI001E10CB10|nr:hypothetical protein [Parvibaculum sp.]MBX3491008.1 hypothetical protein [Parvibaculum sp.]